MSGKESLWVDRLMTALWDRSSCIIYMRYYSTSMNHTSHRILFPIFITEIIGRFLDSTLFFLQKNGNPLNIWQQFAGFFSFYIKHLLVKKKPKQNTSKVIHPCKSCHRNKTSKKDRWHVFCCISQCAWCCYFVLTTSQGLCLPLMLHCQY